jgi:hypothetical protein
MLIKSVYIGYTSAGAYSPTSASVGKIGYVDSNNSYVKKFNWSEESVLLSTNTTKICAKKNSTSTVYSVVNSNKLYVNYNVYIRGAFINTKTGSIELKLNNCL